MNTSRVPISMSMVDLSTARNVVTIFHPSGLSTEYPATADTDAARGVALVAALAAAVSGDVVKLGPGTFVADVTIPEAVSNLSLIGQGMATKLVAASKTREDAGLTIEQTVADDNFRNILIANMMFDQGFEAEFDSTGKPRCQSLVKFNTAAGKESGMVKIMNCLFKWAAGSALIGESHEAMIANCDFYVNRLSVPSCGHIVSQGAYIGTPGWSEAHAKVALAADVTAAKYLQSTRIQTVDSDPWILIGDEVCKLQFPTTITVQAAPYTIDTLTFLVYPNATTASGDFTIRLYSDTACTTQVGDDVVVTALTQGSHRYIRLAVTGLTAAQEIRALKVFYTGTTAHCINNFLYISEMGLECAAYADHNAWMFDARAIPSQPTGSMSGPYSFVGCTGMIRSYYGAAMTWPLTLGGIRWAADGGSLSYQFVTGNRFHFRGLANVILEPFRQEAVAHPSIAGNAIMCAGTGAEAWVAQLLNGAATAGSIALGGNSINYVDITAANMHTIRGRSGIIRGQDLWVADTDDLTNSMASPNAGMNGTLVYDREAKVLKMASDATWVQVGGAITVDARIDDVINSGDATTDGVIDAIRDALIARGIMAAS